VDIIKENIDNVIRLRNKSLILVRQNDFTQFNAQASIPIIAKRSRVALDAFK